MEGGGGKGREGKGKREGGRGEGGRGGSGRKRTLLLWHLSVEAALVNGGALPTCV